MTAPDLGAADISRKWLLAAASFIPITLQSITYISYKAFLGYFQVRPEEAGYDFASLLGQQAPALIIASALTVMVLAIIAFALMYYWHALGPYIIQKLHFPHAFKRRLPFLAKIEGSLVDLRMMGFAFSALVIVGVAGRLGQGVSLSVLPLMAAILSIEHLIVAGRPGHPPRSLWVRLTEANSYSATRVLVLSGSVVLLLSTIRVDGIQGMNYAVTSLVIVFVLDRVVIRPRPDGRQFNIGESVRVPLILSSTLVAGLAILTALTGMDKIMQSGGMNQAIVQTANGRGYASSPFSWKSLVVPNAWPVAISWSNNSGGSTAIPDDIAKRGTINAVLLGQSNGTTVVWWPDGNRSLRLPSATVTVMSRGNPLVSEKDS